MYDLVTVPFGQLPGVVFGVAGTWLVANRISRADVRRRDNATRRRR